jgi:hypothetical protein
VKLLTKGEWPNLERFRVWAYRYQSNYIGFDGYGAVSHGNWKLTHLCANYEQICFLAYATTKLPMADLMKKIEKYKKKDNLKNN